MTIKTITITNENDVASPKVRLVDASDSDIWTYIGSCATYTAQGADNETRDLNYAVECVARKLAQKVSPRNVSIEVVIDPLVPPSRATLAKIEPLIRVIGENASAAVEPGPGTIVLSTWWRGVFVGVDAVAINASIPPTIEAHLMKPGFTTRAGEWDTGFGLHDTYVRAQALHGTVEWFNDDASNGVGFRLSLPINPPKSSGSPEARVVAVEPTPDDIANRLEFGLHFPTITWNPMEVRDDDASKQLIRV